MQEKRTESPMTKIARFIVDKRKAFYLIFIAAFLFCAASINKVQINNDITSYLPAQTETRRGLTIMEEEFITLGSANVMVPNVTYQTALELSESWKESPASPRWYLMTRRSTTNNPPPSLPSPLTPRKPTRPP